MVKRLIACVTSVVLVVFSFQLTFAQSSEEFKALKDEVKGLKEGQNAIRKDLQEIKNLLRSRPAQPQAGPEFKETVMNTDGSYFKGKNDAKVVLIEFSDYQ